MAKIPQIRVEVGTQWLDAKGVVWEVYEVFPFGRCGVRTADRTKVREMQTAAVRNCMTEAIRRDIAILYGVPMTGKTIISQAMSLLGKRKSAAKSAAAQKNGKLGGRPKKPKS